MIAPQAAEVGWILPHTRFNLRRYGSELVRSWAELANGAVASDEFRFDGSDLMPPEIGAGLFWTSIVDLLDGVKTIPEVLADIDAAWPGP